MSSRPKVTIFAPTPVGGLAEHVHYQASELQSQGIATTVLASPDFIGGREGTYQKVDLFPSSNTKKSILAKILRKLQMVRAYRLLRNWISRHPTDLLLLESFSEYLSPFWVHHLVALKRGEITIGANLHDPVRNFVVGPRWWHVWSVKLAYKPIDFVLVHQPIPPEAGVPERVLAHEVPVGIYKDNTASIDKMEAKRLLKIPQEARTFLSFGFIRDNKNLDLFIQAMPGFPDIYLVVAGRNQSQSDKPIDYYRSLAKELGVDDRIRFDTHFISNEEVPIYFSAADQILLTYSNQFRSQSGVLCIAGNYRKPVFASSAESPLKDCVERFNLGTFVEPDKVDQIVKGLGLPREPSDRDWDGFFNYSSWSTNVAPIKSLLKATKVAP